MKKGRKQMAGMMMAAMLMMFPGLCAAEDTAKEPHHMEEMVVSATRSEVPVFDTSQSVTVISKEEITDSPFERIEDILRFSVGIENHSHYGNQTGGVSSHMSMRGVGRNRILMMLDGVPLNDNFNNSIAWVAWGLIPRESIERIEIVRGPSSALYGSDGLGGVVNIITKKPAEKRDASVRAFAGSGDTYGGSALYSQKLSKFGFLLSGGYEDSSGFYMVDPDEEEDYTIKRYRDVGKGFGKFVYSPGDQTDISLSLLYYEHEMGKGREFFYDDLQMDQYRLGLSHRTDFMDWSGLVYLNRADKTAYQDNAADNYTSLDRKEMFPENYNWGAEMQNTARISDAVTLTAGVSYKRVSMDYDEDYTTSARDAGASGIQDGISPFVNAEGIFFDKKLIVNAGARYDWIRNSDGSSWDTKPPGINPYNNAYDSETWDNFSPKIGMVYHPDEITSLRTSLGTGFRAPSLFELYKVHVRSGGRSLRYANPSLEPEEIVTWDIGAERLFFSKVWLRLTYYQSWASDYIGSRTLKTYEKGGKTYTESMLDNISEMEIYGVESEIEWDIRDDLSAFFRYTYNISEITKDEENNSLEGKYLAGDARNKVRAGITYKNPKYVNASLFLRHNSKEYSDSLNTIKVPDYVSVDLSLSRKFFDSLLLRFDIENLNDDEDVSEEGTIYMGSVQFSF
ncbi:MAG: TonB-dependent receptor plug domain-containing protein [Desulfococcaceae bacterium]